MLTKGPGGRAGLAPGTKVNWKTEYQRLGQQATPDWDSNWKRGETEREGDRESSYPCSQQTLSGGGPTQQARGQGSDPRGLGIARGLEGSPPLQEPREDLPATADLDRLLGRESAPQLFAASAADSAVPSCAGVQPRIPGISFLLCPQGPLVLSIDACHSSKGPQQSGAHSQPTHSSLEWGPTYVCTEGLGSSGREEGASPQSPGLCRPVDLRVP